MTLTSRSSSNYIFSCKCIFSLTMGCSNIKLCWYIGHMKSRVLGNMVSAKVGICDGVPSIEV